MYVGGDRLCGGCLELHCVRMHTITPFAPCYVFSFMHPTCRLPRASSWHSLLLVNHSSLLLALSAVLLSQLLKSIDATVIPWSRTCLQCYNSPTYSLSRTASTLAAQRLKQTQHGTARNVMLSSALVPKKCACLSTAELQTSSKLCTAGTQPPVSLSLQP